MATNSLISGHNFNTTEAIAEKIASLNALHYLEKRAARGSREKLLAVLTKAPDTEALFRETLEDWGLLQAIREGENTHTVTRKAVFNVLEAV